MATAHAAKAQPSTSLTTLRRRVASRLGDYTALVATGSGSTTTLIDALNVNAGAENYNGGALLFVGGTAANIGKVARVATTTDSTSTLTFAPAVASATASGDAVDCFNRRGLGFRPADYTFAINQAINDAFPLGVIDLRVEWGAFDADAPEIDVPASLYEVYDVEWADAAGNWHRIPKSQRASEYGWTVDAASGQLRLLGNPGLQADGLTIRLSGYGRQQELSAESDLCFLNAEYVVARACYHLCAGAVTRDASFASLTPLYQKEAEMMKSRIRTIRKPYAERVRPT